MLTFDPLYFRSTRYSSFASGPVVVWNATSQCNLDCSHCYFDAVPARDPDELSTEEAKGLIEDLAGLRVPALLFSGGEPLLREDIFELALFAKEKGLKTALSTNGTLIGEETAKKIKEAGFSYVGISLDGRAEPNDAFRRTKGAFSKTLEGIKNCKDTGLRTGIRFTLTRFNLAELPHIFDIAREEDVDRLCIYHLVYSGRGSSLKDEDVSREKRRQTLDLIWQKTLDFKKDNLKTEVLTVDNHADGVWIYLKLKKDDPQRSEIVLDLLTIQGGNGSGAKIACVDNHGRVYPDQFWRAHPLGNARQDRFSAIWQNRENGFLNDLRNRRAFLKGRCGRCAHLDICNGNFRARAESASGDMWAEDPACYLTEEEIN